jgi:hypothetical protein
MKVETHPTPCDSPVDLAEIRRAHTHLLRLYAAAVNRAAEAPLVVRGFWFVRPGSDNPPPGRPWPLVYTDPDAPGAHDALFSGALRPMVQLWVEDHVRSKLAELRRAYLLFALMAPESITASELAAWLHETEPTTVELPRRLGSWRTLGRATAAFFGQIVSVGLLTSAVTYGLRYAGIISWQQAAWIGLAILYFAGGFVIPYIASGGYEVKRGILLTAALPCDIERRLFKVVSEQPVEFYPKTGIIVTSPTTYDAERRLFALLGIPRRKEVPIDAILLAMLLSVVIICPLTFATVASVVYGGTAALAVGVGCGVGAVGCAVALFKSFRRTLARSSR